MENLQDCFYAVDNVETELDLLCGLAFVLWDSMAHSGFEAHTARTKAAQYIYEAVDRLDNKLKGIVDDGFQIMREEKAAKSA